MRKLLVVSPAPVSISQGDLCLDAKFVSGMEYFALNWKGEVHSALWQGGTENPFSKSYKAADLPFACHLYPQGTKLNPTFLKQFDVVLASGDTPNQLPLAKKCQELGIPLVFVIENTIRSRVKMTFLDQNRSVARKIYGAAVALGHEWQRRRAFVRALGIQANGYPAFEDYCPFNPNTILYLDTRLSGDLLARDAEIEARRRRVMAGDTITILHSGRLESIKGSQHLVPIAKKLREAGVDFRLRIFGTGSLEGEMRLQISRSGLERIVTIEKPVDFKTKLVPFARDQADIFLSCHLQSDPSCSYLENMGCGLPILGYSNRMWSALHLESDAGWVVPQGNWAAQAETIIRLDKSRGEIARKAENAAAFASRHLFEVEFARRVEQIGAAHY